ncbi:MAG TPA: ABC-type transport auxiliary lipoprotein family protein [Polyangiaceae bacterium]|nr:ABC-type transport auxiliary lipoprotein family protein [Polyangiaceae bacterium]
MKRASKLWRWCGALVLSGCLFSCALTSKGDALSPRYFSPAPVRAANSPKATRAFEMRLGQVSSASHLDERIAYRIGGSEMGFYDDRRWTEIPEAYLRRALERELFEQRGLSRIVTGEGPTLDVELTAFEELRNQPLKARVTLAFSLRDQRRSLIERTLEIVQPVGERASSDPAQRLAETMTQALDDAVRELGSEVVAALAAVRATPPTLDQ